MDSRIASLKSTTFCGRRLTRRQIADVQETVALSRNELASRKPGGACTATEPGFVPRCHNVDGHLRKGHRRFPPPSLPCGTQYQSTEKKSSPVNKSSSDLKNIQSINLSCTNTSPRSR